MNRSALWTVLAVVLAWLMAACTLTPSSTPTPSPTSRPLPTATPTASPFPLPTATPSPTPRPPTPTPNVQLVPETYTHPDGLFSLRLPVGWLAQDLSDEREVLVRFDSPATALHPARFLVNIVNTGAPLAADHLPALADAYLQAFLQTLYPLVEPTITTHNGLYTVEVASPVPDPQQQARLRLMFDVQGPLLVVLVQESTSVHWEAVEPVLDSIAASFRLSPDAAAHVPVAAPSEDTALATLTITRTTTYTAPTGTLYLLGVVQATDDRAYADVLAHVRLRDAEGAVLAETEWPLPLPFLPAAAEMPLEVLVPSQPPEWTTWDVTFTGRAAEPAMQGPLPYTITVAQEPPTFGAYAVQAEVRNTTATPLRTLWVVGALYDAEGRPLAVETLTTHEAVPPGDIATVQLLFAAKAPAPVADVRLLVFGEATQPEKR